MTYTVAYVLICSCLYVCLICLYVPVYLLASADLLVLVCTYVFAFVCID